MFDRAELERAIMAHGTVARIVLLDVRGSVPRPAGTAMLVWEGGQSGTIGGGALEYEASRAALKALGSDVVRTYPLGPALGQCCGGSVTVLIETYDAARLATVPEAGRYTRSLPISGRQYSEEIRPAGQPLVIWGAGHVGRAMVSVMAPLPDLQITWVDTGPERFPDAMPHGIDPTVAQTPEKLVPHLPKTADHLILTYSHDIDFALCHSLLSHGFRTCGLIGSETKWARFRKRLLTLGHRSDAISRITCPIGDPRLGKHPQAIAVGVAAALLNASNEQEIIRDGTQWAQHSSHSRG
jgi:xanthine dehydrogenase accessory factor